MILLLPNIPLPSPLTIIHHDSSSSSSSSSSSDGKLYEGMNVLHLVDCMARFQHVLIQAIDGIQIKLAFELYNANMFNVLLHEIFRVLII
jgi:hypothetical protein